MHAPRANSASRWRASAARSSLPIARQGAVPVGDDPRSERIGVLMIGLVDHQIGFQRFVGIPGFDAFALRACSSMRAASFGRNRSVSRRS